MSGLGRDHAMTNIEVVSGKPDRPPAGKPPTSSAAPASAPQARAGRKRCKRFTIYFLGRIPAKITYTNGLTLHQTGASAWVRGRVRRPLRRLRGLPLPAEAADARSRAPGLVSMCGRWVLIMALLPCNVPLGAGRCGLAG